MHPMPAFLGVRALLAALVLCVLFAARCAREIDLDLPGEPAKLVVTGGFEPDSVFKVRLTMSQPVLQNGQPRRPAAPEVLVTEDEFFFERLSMFVENGDTIWKGKKYAKIAQPFSLTVRVSGLPTATATSTAPKQIGIVATIADTAAIKEVSLTDGLRALRVPLLLTISADALTDLPLFAFNLQHENDVYEVLPNGQRFYDYSYQSNTGFVTDGRTFALLHKIPEPVTLIHANYWRDNRKTLRLDALVPFKPEYEKPRRIFVEWRTLSPEFYYYHLSLSRQSANLPLSDPDALYNNVENGYGNFSGFSRTIQSLELPK